METLWVRFEDSVPECGKYRESELTWLAESLTSWDGDEPTIARIEAELRALPLGIIHRIEGKRIVKVQQGV